MTWVTFIVQKNQPFDVLDFYRYAGRINRRRRSLHLLYLPVADWLKDTVHLFQPLMGFFFTLSGFVIMHVYQQRMSTVTDYLGYMKYRLARIYPLHVTTFALFVTIGLLRLRCYGSPHLVVQSRTIFRRTYCSSTLGT